MKYFTNSEYEHRLKIAKRKSRQKELKRNIKEVENGWRATKPKMETSKKLAIYLFVLLNVVVFYCLVAMWYFADPTYLGVLITDIAAQIMIYGIYCLKAYKAKKAAEDMKFERDKLSEMLAAGAESAESVPVNGDVETFEAPEEQASFNNLI